MAPKGRSLQPMASTTDFDSIREMPVSGFITQRAPLSSMEKTMEFLRNSTPASRARRIQRSIYSGPVSSSLKV